jgi:4-hydroxy-3-methylbut-2-enyl diphosphate reductase
MGPRAATRMGERVGALAGSGPVVIAGFCGGLRPEIRTGDVIVASEVRGPDAVLYLSCTLAVAEVLRSAGLIVHVGPMLSTGRLAFGSRRAQAAADGSLGVDMESYWLLEKYAGGEAEPAGRAGPAATGAAGPQPATRVHPGPAAVVRAVSDAAGERFFGGMLPTGWLRAYRSLVRAGAALELWADGLGPSI